MVHLQAHPTVHDAAGAAGVRQKTDWRAAVLAGLVAGLVFLAAEMLMVWAFLGDSPWGPPRMIAAVLLGRGVLPPGDFALAPVLLSALLVHFALSIAYGLLIGWMVHRLATPWALAAGTAFGLFGMYVVNFHLIAPVTFPWFLEARHWVTVLAHALFGAAAAGTYAALCKLRTAPVEEPASED